MPSTHTPSTPLAIPEDFRSLLSPEQLMKLDFMWGNLSDLGKKYFTERDCFRYLRARTWDAHKALKQLEASAEWRKEFKPEEITPDEIEVEAKLKKLYLNGFTKGGLPVIYMKPGRDTNDDNDLKLKYLVYMLEKAAELLPPGMEKMCWLIDFDGFSSKLTGMSNMKMSYKTVQVLQAHFPERLGMAVMVNPPFMFSLFWKMVSPFVDERTKQKIHFLNGKKQTKAFFEENFDFDQLEPQYGGTRVETYVHDDWMAEERARFVARKLARERPVVLGVSHTAQDENSPSSTRDDRTATSEATTTPSESTTDQSSTPSQVSTA